MKAFSDDYRPTETEYEKQKRNTVEKAKRQQELKEKTERDKKELYKIFVKRKNEEVEKALNTLKENEVEKLKDKFLFEFKSNDIFRKILESKGFDSSLVQLQWMKFLANLLLDKSTSSIKYFEDNIYVE